METLFTKARLFITRHARPLDWARWQFHFENGGKENVCRALAAYQNDNGGFGHALEPDAWNPNSSPIQTWAATEILREIGLTDSAHPLITGILRYLASGQDFNGRFWYTVVKSNNDYPHAPWWNMDSDSICHDDYNPTACLAGFIVRFADKDSPLYTLGCRVAQEAAEQLLAGERENDSHTTTCYLRLVEDCEAAGENALFDMARVKNVLRAAVAKWVSTDVAAWDTDYMCKPSQFIASPGSEYYPLIKDSADYECDFIIKTQLDDGSWRIPWGWSDYPAEWAISKNWWKAHGIFMNLLYLQGFKRI